VLTLADVPDKIVRKTNSEEAQCFTLPSMGIDLVETVSTIERSYIVQAVASAGGIKAQAAKLLGINRTTLVEKMKRLKME
jgi:DNA-binding NtrC family response regulator